jgi:uncharacterized low-complexity protein
MKKSMTLGLAIAAAMGSSAINVSADTSPFSATSMAQGYQVAMHHGDKDKAKTKDGKCGEAKCGGHDHHSSDHSHDQGQHKGHDKTHEGNCGGNMKADDAKCGAKDSKKDKDAKCGGMG